MPRPQRGKLVSITGRIKTTFFSSPKFSAGKLVLANGEEISFAGPVYANRGDYFTFKGFWKVHPQYGRQLQVKTVEIDQALSVEGLANYLSSNPFIKGIGPKKAEKIASLFGKNFETVLLDNPEVLVSKAGIPEKTVKTIQEVWFRNKAVNQTMAWLASFDLTYHQVTVIVEKLGNTAILKADPYMLIGEVRGLGFKKVDLIARKMGTPKDASSRIRAGILFVVRESLNQGHCYLDLEDLLDRANELLIMDTLDSRKRIEMETDALLNARKIVCASMNGRFLVADPAMHQMEMDLAALFKKAGDPNPHFPGNAKISEVTQKVSNTLNPGQRSAVEQVVTSKMALICGGAGSGKTYTVKTIWSIYESQGLRIELCAPTGKAAKRLEQVVGVKANTIHRLLGYDGKDYQRGPANPIEADAVIVDEFSMVDSALAWRLLQAVALEKTTVVFVGDHNQLPPVGPGNPMRDLIRTRAIPTVVLTDVVRQAGTLKENCIALLKGEVRKTSEVEKSGFRAWYLVNQFTNPEKAREFLIQLFKEVLFERLGFDVLKDTQVLTPTHKGPIGTKELNVLLQKVIQKKVFGVDVQLGAKRARFYKGDKVIQTRNNYDLCVMNGTVGYVAEAYPNGALTIDFEGVQVSLEPGSPHFRDLQLAYALTIHKAQGSEYPCAVVLIHKSHSFMHHRNLFYTGVTRAKQSLVVLGDRWGIQHCAEKRQVDSRNTFLSHLLAEKA